MKLKLTFALLASTMGFILPQGVTAQTRTVGVHMRSQTSHDRSPRIHDRSVHSHGTFVSSRS